MCTGWCIHTDCTFLPGAVAGHSVPVDDSFCWRSVLPWQNGVITLLQAALILLTMTSEGTGFRSSPYDTACHHASHDYHKALHLVRVFLALRGSLYVINEGKKNENEQSTSREVGILLGVFRCIDEKRGRFLGLFCCIAGQPHIPCIVSDFGILPFFYEIMFALMVMIEFARSHPLSDLEEIIRICLSYDFDIRH